VFSLKGTPSFGIPVVITKATGNVGQSLLDISLPNYSIICIKILPFPPSFSSVVLESGNPISIYGKTEVITLPAQPFGTTPVFVNIVSVLLESCLTLTFVDNFAKTNINCSDIC